MRNGTKFVLAAAFVALVGALILSGPPPPTKSTLTGPAKAETPSFGGYIGSRDGDVLTLTDPSTDILTTGMTAGNLVYHTKELVPQIFAADKDVYEICVQKRGNLVDQRGNDAGTAVADSLCFTRPNAATINWQQVLDKNLPRLADEAYQREPTWDGANGVLHNFDGKAHAEFMARVKKFQNTPFVMASRPIKWSVNGDVPDIQVCDNPVDALKSSGGMFLPSDTKEVGEHCMTIPQGVVYLLGESDYIFKITVPGHSAAGTGPLFADALDLGLSSISGERIEKFMRTGKLPPDTD